MSKYRTEEVKKNSLTLTVEEAARELGISPYLAWKMVKSGQLPTIKLGEKLVRVPRVRLLAMMAGAAQPKQTG